MSETKKIKKINQINVTDVRIGAGSAISDIHDVITTKSNEVTRSHNRRFSRKGVDMLKVLKVAGLEDVSNDELIGRLLETNAAVLADPSKTAQWIEAGKNKRLEYNPTEREGVFNAVIGNVEAQGGVADKLLQLGLKYKERHESFEGFVGVDKIVTTLTGTQATVRVRVGRQSKKDGERYVTLMRAGSEVAGARETLLGSADAKSTSGDADAKGDVAGKHAVSSPVRNAHPVGNRQMIK